jgi:phosphate-selective porin OprO/OprP
MNTRTLMLASGSLLLAFMGIGRADPPSESAPSQTVVESKAASQANGGLEAILPTENSSRVRLESFWDNGYRLESSDKQFRLHIGGNAQLESAWLIGPHGAFAIPGGDANGILNAQGTFLRRVRFRLDGDLWSLFDYAVEYDFANAANENDGQQPPSFSNLTSAPVPCNVWMQIRDVPLFGNVRIGNQVKPIGMTNNTPQTMLPFIERADNMDAFYAPFDNGFALGISARNHTESERATWQYGVYQPSTNSFGVALNKWAAGGRATALPIYEDDGCQLAHVGLGVWASDLVQNSMRVRARTELRNGPGFAVPTMVDTGSITGGGQCILAPEFAAVFGPWTFQAEFAGQFFTDAVAKGLNQGTVFYHGGYAQVLYFLTGEHQNYDKLEGSFDRVVPRNNVRFSRCNDCRTWGAWQIGARFSYLDLNDKGIEGGQVYDLTLGINWFLNPNMKIQLNYILERREAPQDIVSAWINGVGLMAGFDF